MKTYILLISVVFNFIACGNSGSKNQNETGKISGDSDTCNTPDAPLHCLFMNAPPDPDHIMIIADSTEAGTRIIIKGQILKKEDADKFRGLGGVKFLRNFNPSQTPQIASLEIKEAKQRHDYLTSNGSGKSNDILELKAQTTLLSEHLSELQKQNEILLQGFKKLINTKFIDRYK